MGEPGRAAAGGPSEGRGGKTEARWRFAAFLIVALLFGANYHLLTARAAPLWDARTQFAPYFTLIADFARTGQLLVWNPFVNCGSPDFIETQFGALSPITVGFGLLTAGSSAGYAAYWLTLWLLGGLGVLVLGRTFGAPVWGSAAVAIGFLCCGIYTGQAQHLSHLCSFSFLPWVVWRWDVALLTRRWRPAVETGLLWGLSALSGYPGLTVLTGGYLALWAAGRWLFPRPGVDGGRIPSHIAATVEDRARDGGASRLVPPATCCTSTPRCHESSSRHPDGLLGPGDGRAPLAVVVRGLLLVVVTGSAVLAPAYVGFLLEGAGYTERSGGLPREVACYDNALHPLAVATLVSPRLVTLNLDLQAVGRPTLFDYNRPTTSSVYTGAVVVVLALFALASTPRDRWRWWLLAVGLLFLLTAMGRVLPLRSLLYDLFPVSRFFRQTSMFRDYLVVSLVVLALEGARDLSCRLSTGVVPRRLVAISLSLAALAAAVFLTVVWPWRAVADPSTAIALLGSSFGALAVVAAIGARWPDRVAPALPGILVAVAVADGVMSQHISQPIRYDLDPRSVDALHGLYAEHQRQIDLTDQGLMRWDLYTPETRTLNGSNLVVKQPTFENVLPLGNRLHLTLGGNPLLRRTALGPDRVFFSAQAVETAPTMPALGELIRATSRHGRAVLLVHTRGAMRSIRRGQPEQLAPELRARILRLPPMSQLGYELVAYRPRELTLEVEAPQAGWLLVTDRWAGGWRATVNGVATEVWGANLVFRAVRVRRGHNTVRFLYQPPLLAPLLVLSWGVLAAGVATALASAIRLRAGGTSTRAGGTTTSQGG